MRIPRTAVHRSTARRSARWLRHPLALAGAVVLTTGLAVSVVTPAAATPPAAPAAADDGGPRNVLANLFEWSWPSVANECTTVLGPSGYGGVQVAPPQDSLQRQQTGDGSDVLHPWWEVYQPVDYNLTSRMGTEEQFKAMVATCRHAGVKVYVDAVINHMTGQGNTSYGGVSYTKYAYAGLYSAADFHSYPGDCPVPADAGTGSSEGNIADFNDYTQVFKCELVGLSDLRTEAPNVRATIAAYLNKLLDYGVSGFRVDAAKHLGQTDLTAIIKKLHKTVDGTTPYIALEVGTGSPGRISPWAFQDVGDLLGFDYAGQLRDAFKSYNSPPNDGNIGDLQTLGTGSGLLPSDKELVFVENHDTERNGSTLNYKDPSNTAATMFMLAWPHGTPQVYASFAWATPDDSPPADANGFVTPTVCDDTTWVCVDRYLGVRNLVAFRNYVGNAPVTGWTDDGSNLVAFARGSRGFFSVNNAATPKQVTVATGLKPGTYCDIVHGNSAGGNCTGPTVQVNANGKATITVGAYDAVAFTRKDRVSS